MYASTPTSTATPRAERSIAYLPQRSVVDWDFPLTVRGLAEMGRYPALGNWGKFGADDRRIVDDALAATRLTDLADRQISALLRGPAATRFPRPAPWLRARTFICSTKPFTGLDRNAQVVLSELLRSLASDQGKLVVVSHHDLRTRRTTF